MQKRLLPIGVLVGALLSATLTLGQQPDPAIETLDKRVTTFFEAIKAKNIPGAYLGLLSGGQVGTPEERKKLEDETAKIESLYGTYRGAERVYVKQVGTDLVFLKYLYKCGKFPVLWHVTFYRTPATGDLSSRSPTWQLVSIRFDTDLEVLTLLKE